MTLDGTPVTDAQLFDEAVAARDKPKTDREYRMACWALSLHARLQKARRAKLAAEAGLDQLRAINVARAA